MFIQLILNGLLLGSIYALIASGLALLFGVVGLPNFAHGEFYMMGGFAMWAIDAMTGNYLLGVIFAMAFMASCGFVIERIVIRPVAEKFWAVPMLATLGLSLALQNSVLFIYGANPHSPITPLTSLLWTLPGDIVISGQRLTVMVVTGLAFLTLHVYLTKTRGGKAMRAVSQNRDLCRVVGVNIGTVFSTTFVISAMLAGLGGALIGPIYLIYPRMGTVPVFKAFAIVVAGGLNNVKGSIYLALLVGIAESLFGGYISGTWNDAVAFLLLIIALVFRPQGLFGKKVGVW